MTEAERAVLAEFAAAETALAEPPFHCTRAHAIASFTGPTRRCHHRHRGDAAGDLLFP